MSFLKRLPVCIRISAIVVMISLATLLGGLMAWLFISKSSLVVAIIYISVLFIVVDFAGMLIFCVLPPLYRRILVVVSWCTYFVMVLASAYSRHMICVVYVAYVAIVCSVLLAATILLYRKKLKLQQQEA